MFAGDDSMKSGYSTIERNAGWVTTEYNNQSSPGTFITMGSENCATPTQLNRYRPTPTPPDNTFLTSLYAYYKLDETGGGATDASGNGKTLSHCGDFIGTARASSIARGILMVSLAQP